MRNPTVEKYLESQGITFEYEENFPLEEKQMLPRIENYGNYSSSNYGAHCLRVHIGPLTVWFSYQTPVAFAVNGKRIVRQNDWGPTTGKHLNTIDNGDKSSRVSGEEFDSLWEQLVEPLLNRNQITQ